MLSQAFLKKILQFERLPLMCKSTVSKERSHSKDGKKKKSQGGRDSSALRALLVAPAKNTGSVPRNHMKIHNHW